MPSSLCDYCTQSTYSLRDFAHHRMPYAMRADTISPPIKTGRVSTANLKLVIYGYLRRIYSIVTKTIFANAKMIGDVIVSKVKFPKIAKLAVCLNALVRKGVRLSLCGAFQARIIVGVKPIR